MDSMALLPRLRAPRRLWGAGSLFAAAVLALLPAGPVAGGPGGWPSVACDVRVPVLVVGGTPAGVAAAVTAARMGQRVLLTESRPYLGGVLTGAMLNMFDMDVGPRGQNLARGVFLEIYDRLGTVFDVERAKRVFLDEVRREPLLSLRLLTHPVAVVMRGPWITGVVVQNTLLHMTQTVCAQRIVDATDDADVAALAGVPYTLGRAASGVDHAMMSATLVFEVGGVSWPQVVSHVTGRARHHMARGIHLGDVWGYGEIMRGYRPAQPGVAVYDLNIGLQNRHTVLINGLLVFGVDGTDPDSVADGMRRAKSELPTLLDFMRTEAPGFSHAYLVRTADYLYIRETRHIRGLYTLTAQDIVSGRVFWDAIGVANYPIDLHPYQPGELNPYAAVRYTYTIPFRSLIPVGVDNLVVAARSISATYEAAGSARIVATTMEEGQAAGAAAALSIRDRVAFPRIARNVALVHALQGLLYVQGAYLLPETVASTDGHAVRWPPVRRRPFGGPDSGNR
jgi:hypothetical protein